MKNRKFLTFLLSLLMVFSQLQGIFAFDNVKKQNQNSDTSKEIELDVIEQDDSLIFDLGKAIDEVEKLDLKGKELNSDGLEISEEKVGQKLKAYGDQYILKVKVEPIMKGLNNKPFDWTVFNNEQFVTQLGWRNKSTNKINLNYKELTFTKENVSTPQVAEITTTEVEDIGKIAPIVKVPVIDGLDVRGYISVDRNNNQSEGVYTLKFDVIEIINPVVKIAWKSLNGESLAENYRPSDTDLVSKAKLEGLNSEVTFNLKSADGDYNLVKGSNRLGRVSRDVLNKVSDVSAINPTIEGIVDGKVTFGDKEYKVKTSYSKYNGTVYTLTFLPDVIKATESKTKPDGYVEVKFDPTSEAKDPRVTIYYVKNGTTWDKAKDEGTLIQKVAEPSVPTNKDTKKSFVAFRDDSDKVNELGKKLSDKTGIVTDTIFTAKYAEDIVPEEPNKPKPDVPYNFVLVEFLAGDHGSLRGTTRYWVNPTANKSIGDLKKPDVVVDRGYRHTGWDTADTVVIDSNKNVKAKYELTSITVSFDVEAGDDANAPRHNETVVKGKLTSETGGDLIDAVVVIKDSENNVIGRTLANTDGTFTAGTRELKAGEELKIEVTPKGSQDSVKAANKIVKLNPDRLNELLPIAKAQDTEFSKKPNAFDNKKLEALKEAIKNAEPLVDDNGKATGANTFLAQQAIDEAVKALEKALKELVANIPPAISGQDRYEIFVGEVLDLDKLVDITDGDGADDIAKKTIVVTKDEVVVSNQDTINQTPGEYKVVYTVKDKSNAEVSHEMTLKVKMRTASAIEVTTDPVNMNYLIKTKDGKAKLNLEGMTLNLVDNLGDKKEVQFTDPKVKLKVNGRLVSNGADLTLDDDVQFIDVEYTPKDTENTLKAKTSGVLRVGPDYDKDGKDDRSQDFDITKVEKLDIVKQPQLDYIAKDKTEAKKVFKLNLEGMIVRMTDKAGKEKLAIVKEDGKFYDYDNQKIEITGLTTSKAQGVTLIPETSESEKGDNGQKITVTAKEANKSVETDPLKVFYDANKDGKPDYGEDQKTPAPSAMARNIGDTTVTTIDGVAMPGSLVIVKDKKGHELGSTTAGDDGKYKVELKNRLNDGTDIQVTAKLGEMLESDPTKTTVFDDKNDNKIPDGDEGFNIKKATSIKFINEPDLTYLVEKDTDEVIFDAKDAKGEPIYLELSYKNGEKTESKIYTLEELIKDNENIKVTPANGTKDKIKLDLNDSEGTIREHNLVGKTIEVKLNNVEPETETSKATTKNKFAIKIDADKNNVADEFETTETPTATARNIGENPTKTTVEGKAPKNSTVTIKYKVANEEKTTTVTAGEDGSYKAEISPKLPAKTEIAVTAKDGKKKESAPFKTIVFDDKNDNGKDDESEDFDITKADKIEMVYDPAKMDYLVTEENKTVTLETKGMLVKVIDKLGKEKTFTAEELAEDITNFKVEPKEGTKLTLNDNDKPIKVTLNNSDATKNEVQTSRNLSVKLDKDGNNIPDDKEQFDIKKATKVEIIKNPDKMDYLVKTKDGKAKFDTTGLVIKLTDDSGKAATYTAKELKKEDIKDKIVLNPSDAEELGLKAEGKTNRLDFTVTIIGADAEPKPTVKANKQIVVKLDADGNEKADEDEITPEPTVIASNKGEGSPGKETPATKTTVEVKTEPNAKVKIEYKGGEETKIIEVIADGKGEVTETIEPKLEAGTEIKVTAKDGEKKPTTKTANVFDDLDNDRKDDNVAGFTERPAAIASNKGKEPAFTTISGKTEVGATITVEVKDGQKNKAVKVDNLVVNDEDGSYTLNATLNGKPLENGAEILVYAKKSPKKKSAPQITTVFNDFNEDGKPDGGKVDVTDVKDVQVIAPNKMDYTNGETLNASGLKAVIRDNKGGIEIFDYDSNAGKFKDADGKIVEEITANVDGDTKPLKDLVLSTKKHHDKAIEVKVGNIKGASTQKLQVNELQTPTPTIVFAANQNTVGSDGKTATSTAKNKTTVKFTVKNQPTTVYIKYQYNGKQVEETIDINSDNDKIKTVDLQNLLPVGTEVQVLAKDAGKSISKVAATKVVRDANNDGNGDDKTKLIAPAIDDIKAGSANIMISKPMDGVEKIVVTETDKNGQTPQDSKAIEIVKDDNGNWKIGDTLVNEESDKLVIPTKDKLKLDEYNTVKVEVTGNSDTTEPDTSTKVVGKAADKTAPATPIVDAPIDGDEIVKVKTPTEPDAKKITIEITKPGKPGEHPKIETIVVEKDSKDGKWKTGGKEVPEKDGKLEIPINEIKEKDTVKVVTSDDSNNESKPYIKDVVAKETLPVPTIKPIKTGEKTVSGTAKKATTVDIYKKAPDGDWTLIKKDAPVGSDNSYTYNDSTGFKDGDQVRVVAKKDKAAESSAETTVGVDTTEIDKKIEEAKSELEKRNDGTPTDKTLEEAIKEGEDIKKKEPAPSQDEIDKVKDKIEKAIEEKKAYDEAHDKLKEKIKEAEDKKNDPEYPTKPDKVKNELDESAKDGKKVDEDKTSTKESIDKAIENIQEKLDQYNKQQIGANVSKVFSTSNTVQVVTTAPNAKVEVYISELDTSTWEEVRTLIGSKTSTTKLIVVSLNQKIPKGTNLFIKVTHDKYLSFEDTIIVE